MNLEELGKPVRAEQVVQMPWLEKLVAILGVLVVIFVLAVIAYEAKVYDDKPPEILIENVQVVPQESGFLVKILARNKGSQATADLVIEGRVGEGESAETSTVTFDYVPAHSTREGGLFFGKNPEGLKLRALGYQRP